MTRMIGHPFDIDPPSSDRAELIRRIRDRRKGFERGDILDGPLHVVVGERQTGKTHLAVRWLTDAPEGVRRVLITSTGNSANVVRDLAGFTTRDERVLSVAQFQARRAAGTLEPGTEYGIDETVEVLTQLLRLPSMPRLLTVGLAEAWQGTEG